MATPTSRKDPEKINYVKEIHRILEDEYGDDDLSYLNDEKRIKALQELYKRDRVAQRVLANFAQKTNWREISLLHRVAKEADVSEKEAREFLKGVLETLDLGKYIKGVHGNKSRFQWYVYEPESYFLRNVGLASQGQSQSLRGDGLLISDEDDEDAIGEEVEVAIPLPNNRTVTVKYPSDITDKEYQICLQWFQLYVNLPSQ